MSQLHLKTTLNRFYKEFDFKQRVKHDPIEFPRRYSRPEDIEVAGFISACLAYGRVALFKPVIEKLLEPGGKHPAGFFADLDMKKDKKYFKGITYRFNTEKDILCLVHTTGQALRKYGSLKNLFCKYYGKEDASIRPALTGFVDFLLGIDTSPVYGRNIKPPGYVQLFPNPKKGSACKRMNLFLRWMVRTKDIDLGIWDNIPPSKLIIPLDTHIAKISKCLGLTKRSSSDWKTAHDITSSLKEFDSEDPLKYDFALCHHGISGQCKGNNSSVCSECAIKHGSAGN